MAGHESEIKDNSDAKEQDEQRNEQRIQQARAEAMQIKQADLKAMQKALEEAQLKAQENYDKMLRAKSDSENIRRRATLDIEKAHKYGTERLAKELLNVLDSLESALSLNTENTDDEHVKSIHKGIELTYKMLLDILDKFGIKKLSPAKGDALNPALHEALSVQATDEIEPNKILTVIQPGFTIYERVLRPARVIVSKSKALNN